LVVLIADACGHGMASALLVGDARAYLRALSLTCSDVGQMLTLTNSRFCVDTNGDYFVTAMLTRLDPRTLSLDYSNAGHCAGFILDNRGQTRVLLDSLGYPLGIDQTSEFITSPSIQLRPRELVLLSSDGIAEAHSPDGRLFGIDRMLETVRAHRDQPLDAILDSLFLTVNDFTRPSIPHDDMTAVLIRVESGV
jgi:serine phosphatase RsbU (regulator of sigma subunit)